jgi:hypothetical protein
MTGDLGWLDRALAPSRQRARAVDSPVPEPAPPTPPEPEPPAGPSPPPGKMVPAGPMSGSPASGGDFIRAVLHRHRRR